MAEEELIDNIIKSNDHDYCLRLVVYAIKYPSLLKVAVDKVEGEYKTKNALRIKTVKPIKIRHAT